MKRSSRPTSENSAYAAKELRQLTAQMTSKENQVATIVKQTWTIPYSWEWLEIGDVAAVVGGGTPKTSDPSNFEDGEIPWITPADLSGYGEKYIACGSRNITEQGLKKSSARLLPAGTVLFSSRAPIGYVAIASQPVTTNQGFKSFVLPGGIDPSFVYHYLTSAKETIEGLGGGTTFKELSGAAAGTIPLPIAPLAEQRRIVAEIETQFTRLDASVAELRRAQANLKRYRASVLKDACEGRLVPTEAELARSEGREYEPAGVLLERILAERRARWESQEKRRGKYKEPSAPDTSALPELPEGWVWATVEQLSEIQGGIQKQPKRAPVANPYPFLRVANVLRGSLDLEEVHQIELFPGELDKLRLIAGDLLIVEGNGSPTQIGRMAIWKGDIEDCVHQNHIIRARLVGGLSSEYAATYWNSPTGSSEVSKVASSTSGLYTLSVSKVSVLPVPLPPLAEQRRIVAEVERRLSVVQQAEAAVEASLARAERLRQSILKQAFTGRLVPQDPDDEPASALLGRIRAERESEAEASRAAKGKSRTRRARKATA